MLLAFAPGEVKPGLLGFAVVAGLAVALFFLVRSMMKQMRKIDFEERPTRSSRPSDSRASRSNEEQPSSAGQGEEQHGDGFSP